MAINSDSISLLFKASGQTEDAQRAFKDLEKSIGVSTGAVAGLGAAVPIAGAAIAAMAAGVAIAVVGLYNLTKQASEYGSQIFDAQAKTGLAAATLSTLKITADNAGSSFETVTGSVVKFSQLLAQAKNGNEKATATLKQYGITATDTDTALKQAIASIAKMETADLRAAAAKELFKDRAGALLPVIEQLNGDLEAATKEAERLGLTLTEKDIAASDAFGDSLGVLAAQAQAAAVAFTSDLMPVLTQYFVMASEWYARNQQEVRYWGSVTSMVIADFARGVGIAFDFVRDHAEMLRVYLSFVTLGLSELVIVAGKLIAENYRARVAAQGNIAQEGSGQAIGAISSPAGPGGGKSGGGGGGAQKSAVELAREANRKELDLIKQAVSETLSENEKLYSEGLRLARDYYEEKSRMAVLELQEEIRLTEDLLNIRSISAKDRLEVEHQLVLLRSKLRERENKEATETAKREKDAFDKALDDSAAALAKFDELRDASREKEEKEEERQQQIRATKSTKSFEEKKKQLLILRGLREEEESRTLAGMAASNGGGFLGNIKDIFDDKGNLISKGLGVMGLALQELKDIGMDAFGALAQGFGHMLANWVLMGDAGTSFRKFTAQLLASVAQQAATMAIMSLGYAALATTAIGAITLGGTPAQFLQAAALFGAVALGTALVGRAVAGDAFKKETSGAFGSATSSSNRSGNNQVYSSQSDQINESGRNTTIPRIQNEIVLKIRTTKDHIVEVVKENISNNGTLRTVIQDAG